jgi:hypothetical protein
MELGPSPCEYPIFNLHRFLSGYDLAGNDLQQVIFCLGHLRAKLGMAGLLLLPVENNIEQSLFIA